MSSIGVRQLKAQLSQQLKRVQRGGRLTITDRGKPIAVLSPVEPQANAAWGWRMVAAGKARLERRQTARPAPAGPRPRHAHIAADHRGPAVTLYLDTSVLVKLYIREDDSEEVDDVQFLCADDRLSKAARTIG